MPPHDPLLAAAAANSTLPMAGIHPAALTSSSELYAHLLQPAMTHPAVGCIPSTGTGRLPCVCYIDQWIYEITSKDGGLWNVHVLSSEFCCAIVYRIDVELRQQLHISSPPSQRCILHIYKFPHIFVKFTFFCFPPILTMMRLCIMLYMYWMPLHLG